MPAFLPWLALLVLLFQALVQAFIHFGLLRIGSIQKGAKPVGLPPISVIVAAKDEAANIADLVHSLAKQDYPTFEIVVADDGSTDGTDRVLTRLKAEYPMLRTVSPASKGKKAALDAAIEAARYEHLAFTDADCIAHGNRWLASIGEAFATGAELIAGNGLYRHKDIFSKVYAAEALRVACLYHAAIAWGFPYMCVGRSMAYTKSAFQNVGGISRLPEIDSGSDDLLFRLMSEGSRLRSVPEALTYSAPPPDLGSWIKQKKRHLATAPYYPMAAQMFLILNDITLIISPLIVIWSLVYVGQLSAGIIAVFLIQSIFALANFRYIRNLSKSDYEDEQLWLHGLVGCTMNALISVISTWVKKSAWTTNRQAAA